MARPVWTVLLPCVGIVALGSLTASADPEERTGSDAPHHERNEAKNEKKTALALSEVEVPVVAGKPVKKATAVKEDSTSRSRSKDKKKADRVAKEKEKAKPAATTPADAAQDRRSYDAVPDDFVGTDAPRQERNSDPSRHAARLFILER